MITVSQLMQIDAIAKEAVKNSGLDEMRGACGFAWVNVYGIRKKEDKLPLSAAGFKRSEYEKCQQKWISGYGQSVGMKDIYATAYAKELQKLGYRAFSSSRLD